MRTVLTSLFLVFLTNVCGQSILERHPRLFEHIDTMDERSYSDSTVLENKEFLEHVTDGGGELIGYFVNTELKKIKATVGLSNGIETNEYYYDSEGLLFVRVTFESFMYDTLMDSFDHEKTEMNFIGNYIYVKDKLIDLESLGHYPIEQEHDIEQYLLVQSKSFVRIIKSLTN